MNKMRTPDDWSKATTSFIRKMKRDGCYADRTIRFYREHCLLVGKRLETIFQRSLIPPEIQPNHVTALLESMRADGLAIATQRNYTLALKMLCVHYDNHVFAKVKILWPSDTRPTVDWLTPDQARKILDSDLTPLQEALITLELCAGLRRIEILRLTVDDIHPNFLDIHGKGHIGGKLRSVPIQQRVRKALDRWLDERRFIIESVKEPDYVTDKLFVYVHGKKIYGYSDVKATGIDRHLKMVCQATGIKFSNHTLRRTFARQLWLSGAPLVTIAKILGHTSTEQTLLYIGANNDDMQSAMALLNF